MKGLRIFLSITALLFGVVVVGTSLSSASQVHSQEETKVSSKTLYFDEEILPDHLLYPFLAASDKARLELATPEDRIYLQLVYGQRRFEYAQSLLKKDNHALAVTTLTKSQKYFNLAAQSSLDNKFSLQLKKYVLNSLNYHLKAVQESLDNFDPNEKTVIEKLMNESKALKDQLEENL